MTLLLIIETRGVYIQDVDLPQQLVDVLTAREIANQQKATFVQERQAQDERVLMEKVRRHEISHGKIKIVPDVLVAGGGDSIEGLVATLMSQMTGNGKYSNGKKEPEPERKSKKVAPESPPAGEGRS